VARAGAVGAGGAIGAEVERPHGGPHMPDPCTCLFCLTPRSMTARWDKKGRPYLACSLCRHRIFTATGLAFANVVLMLRGIDHVAPTMRTEAPKLLARMYGTDRPDLAAVTTPLRENIRELPALTGGAA